MLDVGESEVVTEFPYRSRRSGSVRIRLEGHGPDDHIFRVIRRRRSFYEIELLRYVEGVLGRGPRGTVFDVGANIGNHAVFFARFLASRVIAIEPNPAVLPVLERNLRRNAPEGCRWSVIQAAAGSAQGLGSVVVPDEADGNIGMARVEVSAPGQDPEQHVRITTIDNLADRISADEGMAQPVRLIKVDVEGSELAVLKGAERVLERFSPHLLVEAVTGDDKAALDRYLGPMGYVALRRHGATPVYHYARDPSWSLRSRAMANRIWSPLHGRLPWI